MKHVEKLIGIGMLMFAIGFNLWLYRVEPSATTDPNDNAFQFALVDRENQIWDFALQTCPKNLSFVICHVSYLTDHWVPNWAEGYNLPYYYSHVPQIVIVALWRIVPWGIPLFAFYHWVIYILLSFFPASMFAALALIGLSPVAAGFGALISTQISTDGLYGLDPSSFLWRGYGLSSQLFAMIWLPLAIAFSFRLLNSHRSKQNFILAILTLAATTAGHLGIGIIAFLSVGAMAISPIVQGALIGQYKQETRQQLVKNIQKLLVLCGGSLLLLGYWIIPVLKDGNYHNISVWDPIWKFNSYGATEILKNFFNGDLFDFGRMPILTLLVLVGLFATMKSQYFSFSLLFFFWLAMYFGRTTWGSFIDLIPGMKDFHLSRFIVGIHLLGLFLAPIGALWIIQKISTLPARIRGIPAWSTNVLGYVMLGIVLFLVYPQTVRYASVNDVLIARANANYSSIKTDVDGLFSTLYDLEKARPGRVFAGRGGSWGRDFRVAETPYYMILSTYGIPTVLWLPETWSPNSDTEQYFNENRMQDYNLYNIRYVVTPPTQPSQPLWKLLKETKTWKLYEVETAGYITSAARPAVVSSSKENFLNVVHLWIQSDYPKQGLYPELTFMKDYPRTYGLPNFRMLDEVTYQIPDGSIHNLFAQPPNYVLQQNNNNVVKQYSNITILSQSGEGNMVFKARVQVPENCTECLVILKQSFHPSWQVTVDGKPQSAFAVFPFFTAVKLDEPGTHDVVFSYRPSNMKVLLLIISLVTLGGLSWIARPDKLQKFKARV